MNYANCMRLFHKYSLMHILIKHQLRAVHLTLSAGRNKREPRRPHSIGGEKITNKFKTDKGRGQRTRGDLTPRFLPGRPSPPSGQFNCHKSPLKTVNPSPASFCFRLLPGTYHLPATFLIYFTFLSFSFLERVGS